MGGLQNPVVKRSLDESGSRWKGMAQQRQTHGEQGSQLATTGDGRDPPAWGREQPRPPAAILVHRSRTASWE